MIINHIVYRQKDQETDVLALILICLQLKVNKINFSNVHNRFNERLFQHVQS